MRVLLLASLALSSISVQQTTFKSGVEVVAVDVHVVDRDGTPIADLRPDEFDIRVGGRSRRVVSALPVAYDIAVDGPRDRQVSRVGSTAPRRMFLLAIDEHSLPAGAALAARAAAERFLDKLGTNDLVGLYAYPTGTARQDFTSNHTAVRSSLQNVTGLFDEPGGKFNLSPSEIVDCANGDADVLRRVHSRECARGGCSPKEIQSEAVGLAVFLEMSVSRSVRALRDLVESLGAIPGRKIVVVISGGLVSGDRVSGRVNETLQFTELGRAAGRSDLAVFVLHLDWSFVQALASKGGLRTSFFRDSNMSATGLEMIAGAAGGSIIRVHGTDPERAFDRILRETSAYYVLGFEVDVNELDGRSQPLRVTVKRRGAIVRSRSEALLMPR
jgi:VWFA-related protein